MNISGTICGSRVLDLPTHLIRTHGLSLTDQDFSTAIANSETCNRISHCSDASKLILNPSFNFNDSKVVKLTKEIAKGCYDEDKDEFASDKNVGEEETCKQFVEAVDSDPFCLENVGESSKVFYYSDLVKESISKELYSSIEQFSDFLRSVYGGAKSVKSIQMDTSNIIILINGIGEKHLFDANKINMFISCEITRGRAPSTSYSRLHSLIRFVDFVKFHNISLIPNSIDVDKFLSIIRGMEHSLLRLRLKRNKLIMSNSRKMYHKTLQVMSEWSKARSSNDVSSTISVYINNPELKLTQSDFEHIRGFFILEIIIPNGQRPGVIEGLIIGEIFTAESDVVENVHRVFVAKHKTCAIQPATIFINDDVFELLLKYIGVILPKLPNFNGGLQSITIDTHAFLTFGGKPLLSSRLTPIFKLALKSMGIFCDCTITDFRKVSVSLTGKYCPELQEIMAQFFCHSRIVHEKSYNIQLGHSGLIKAFKALETMQSNPFSPVHEMSTYRSLGEFCSIPTHDLDEIDVPETFEVDRDSPVSQSFVLDIDSSPYSRYDDFIDNVSEEIITPGIFSHSSYLNNPTVSNADANYEIPIFDESSQNSFELYDQPSRLVDVAVLSQNSPLNLSNDEDINEHTPQVHPDTNNFFQSSIHSDFSDTSIKLKDCSINLVKHNFARDFSANSSTEIASPINRFPHHRSIFRSLKDEELFLKIFSNCIKCVVNKTSISKKLIISIANTDTRCKKLLQSLEFRYPNEDVYSKLYMKVRTVGFHRRAK